MRPMLRIPALLLLAMPFIFVKCPKQQSPKDEYKGGVSILNIGKDTSNGIFRANEIIVAYKHPPAPGEADKIKDAIAAQGITVTDVQKCNSCDSYIELWKGSGIHTTIHSEGVSGGSGGGSKGVGEDSIAQYSLNFVMSIPADSLGSLKPQYYNDKPLPFFGPRSRDTIVIAVLDTGVDTTRFVNNHYLWMNRESRNDADDDSNCFVDDLNGWNFIDKNANVHDDNGHNHGSLVTSYIIKEFERDSAQNFVQIMSLKTHDKDGFGDLFSSICAIHYAVNKGANIINASWGFYYYQSAPHPYMDSLITHIVRDKGILFIAAAGNKIETEDAMALDVYRDSSGRTLTNAQLRDLRLHHFYPANLSRADNNVLTVTTINNGLVSPTQNWSNDFVDLGVNADHVTTTGAMQFQQPLSSTTYISGSSFAAAIATGKIGAFLPKGSYVANISKPVVLKKLKQLIATHSIPVILFQDTRLNAAVKDGAYTKRK